MPRTRSGAIDVTLPENLHKASLSQLTRLSWEALQLHLSSQTIYAKGTTKELARTLFNALRKKPLGLRRRQQRRQSSKPLVSSASTTKKKTRSKRKTIIKQDVLSLEEPKIPKTKKHSKKKKSNPENVFCLPAPESTIVKQTYDHQTKHKMTPSNANQLSSNLQSTTSNSPRTSMPPLLIPREIRDSIVKGEFIDFTQL